MEQPLVITNREELIFMLCEASQLEHMLLCEYLFAAFSLKNSVDEGLTPTQLEAVTRWERVISGVAVQEMLHLALATNMLTAIGGAPYLTRPNFPQQAKYFPAGIQLALLPFGEHALRHFLYLERPEGMALQDAPEFALIGAEVPVAPNDEIVPALENFATVGHLYRGIEHGFQTLCERYGERQVFIGPVKAQATARYFGWPELIAVTGLASAATAIETIVEEGEGARGDWTKAHYGKFLGVFQEYRAMKEQDARFEPARPVIAAMARPPADASGVTLIGDPLTCRVANLFNASYEVSLQLLNRFFVHSEETLGELQTLSSAAVSTMLSVIKPLGRLLTTLPAGPGAPGMTAGPSFEIYRTGYLLPHRDAAWTVLHERLLELAGYCGALCAEQPSLPDLAAVEASLRRLAENLAHHQRPKQAPDDAEAMPVSAMPRSATEADAPISATTADTPMEGTTMVSFARDIRPLFRATDLHSMAWAFDLGDYDAVKTHAEGIYQRLSDGTMPCDSAWPGKHIALFKQWMDAAFPT